MNSYFAKIKNLFANHLSREMKELYLSSTILHFASSSISIFEPIYFIKVGMSIGDIFIFYGAIYLLYFLGLPIGGRLARMHGYEHVMLWSSPFLIIYYLSLFAIPYNPGFLVVAVIAIVIQKILYWPGYHADFARFGHSEQRGREIGSFVALLSTVGIFGPIFGGAIIAIFGFNTLFVIVAALIILSNIPMLTTPEKFTPVNFSYGKTMKNVFQKKNLRQTAAFIGYGEDAISNIIWSIFIAVIVKDLFTVGAIVSGSILLHAIIAVVIGSLVDRHKRLSIQRLGTVITSFIWFMRTFVTNGVGVFLTDNFYRISRNVLGTSMMSIIYDEAKSSSVMEVMIFREMGLALGKLITAGLCIVLWIFVGDNYSAFFILAGILGLFYLLLKERVKKDGLTPPPMSPDITAPITQNK